jgi:hypothetical protein
MLLCLANLPPLERFLYKFGKMHSRWTESRYKLFSTRNQSGGDADASHTCPLCAYDGRNVALAQVPGHESASNSPMKRAQGAQLGPDMTISSKMVCSPFALKSPNRKNVPLSNSSSPIKNKMGRAKTPPLRLNSPPGQSYDSDVLSARNQFIEKVKSKNW